MAHTNAQVYSSRDWKTHTNSKHTKHKQTTINNDVIFSTLHPLLRIFLSAIPIFHAVAAATMTQNGDRVRVVLATFRCRSVVMWEHQHYCCCCCFQRRNPMSQSSLLHRGHTVMSALIFPSTNRSWCARDDAIIYVLRYWRKKNVRNPLNDADKGQMNRRRL